MAETFGDLVAGWKPVNEPVAHAAAGSLGFGFAPGHNDFDRDRRARPSMDALAKANAES